MNKNTRLLALSVFLISIFNIALSQNIWESFGTSSSPWIISSKLTTYSNTSNRVDVKNMNFESADNKKNGNWTAENIWINTSNYNESPLDIAFSIKSLIPSNLDNIYAKGGWHWKVRIRYTTISGQDKYFDLLFSTGVYNNSKTTYQSSNTNDNGVYGEWHSVSTIENRRFRILFDDNQIKLYDNRGDNLVKTLYGIKKVNSIVIGLGPGTELEITNTNCQKRTIYGQSLPFLQKAANYLDNNNASSAASEMTTAINKGLKCYDTYLMRGVAYYMQGYYKSAIEDLTSAISCSASNKEMAYYYRGMSKLALDDDYGINDLKNGGQDGIVFLRENNLMNYTPGQSKKKTTTPKKPSSSSRPKKPALKK